MAKARSRKNRSGRKRTVRIAYVDPDRVSLSYINNFFINHTEHEFVITLAQAPPPPILHMTQEQLDALDHVEATVVARIAMSPGRFRDFVKAAVENYDTWANAQGQEGM